MNPVTQVFPSLRVPQWVPHNEPLVPFTGQRARLSRRERHTFAGKLRADGRNTARYFCFPVAKLLLRIGRAFARRGEELCLKLRAMRYFGSGNSCTTSGARIS